MRTHNWKLWTIAAAVAAVVSGACALQFATAEAPPSPPDGVGRREPGPPPRGPRGPRHGDEKPMTAKGKVTDYAKNPDGDIDGLILTDGVEVKFPPHQSKQLQEAVAKGDEVTVEGRRHETPEGDVHLHARSITVAATGKSIEADEPRDRRPPPRDRRGPDGDRDRGPGRGPDGDDDRGPGRGPDRGPGRGPEARPERGPGGDRDRPEPPHEEILRELREIRRLIEAQSRK